jgi:chromosome segregation ATPase
MNYRRILPLLLCLRILAVGESSAREDKPEIRIPAIVQSWKSNSTSDDKDITIEEIGACIGVDLRIRTKFLELQREKAAIDEEFERLPKFDERFIAEATALRLEDQRLKNLATSVTARQDELSKRRTQLDRSRPAANAKAEQIKTFNTAIAEFNDALSVSRSQIDELNASIEKFRGLVQAFNSRLEIINKKILPFNDRTEAFRVASAEFRTNYGSHLNKCAGERKVRK